MRLPLLVYLVSRRDGLYAALMGRGRRSVGCPNPLPDSFRKLVSNMPGRAGSRRREDIGREAAFRYAAAACEDPGWMAR